MRPGLHLTPSPAWPDCIVDARNSPANETAQSSTDWAAYSGYAVWLLLLLLLLQ